MSLPYDYVQQRDQFQGNYCMKIHFRKLNEASYETFQNHAKNDTFDEIGETSE
jgi:hypothetical protein